MELKRAETDPVSGDDVSAPRPGQRGWEAAACRNTGRGWDHRPCLVYLGLSRPLWAVTWAPGLAAW